MMVFEKNRPTAQLPEALWGEIKVDFCIWGEGRTLLQIVQNVEKNHFIDPYSSTTKTTCLHRNRWGCFGRRTHGLFVFL